jgi:voltage-gated potassium channel
VGAGLLRSSLRDRYNGFIDRHEVAWELIMGALAAVFAVIGFAGDDANPATLQFIAALELGLTAVFVAEFATRLAAAQDRRRYLRGHWIDLVALIPTTRGVRLLRLLRLLRLIRTFTGVYRALTSIERLATHKGLVWLFVAWLTVAVICSIALYVAEAGVNENIATPLDALWWGVVTLTTVGYGDVFPVTPEGRLAAATLMILGITLFAAITGTITSALVARDQQLADLPAQLERLAELHARGALTDAEFAMGKARLLGADEPRGSD